MKKNGFIATSLLYTFFLAFIALFTGMIAIYLQNRVYLIKLEDSSKNAIYIREIKNKIDKKKIDNTIILNVSIKDNEGNEDTPLLDSYTDNIFNYGTTKYNLTKCELIYYENNTYYLEGCPAS